MRKQIKKTLCLYSLLLISTLLVFSKVKVEELESQLSHTKGKERITVLMKLTDAFLTDSPAKAFQYAKEALELLEKFPDRQQRWKVNKNLSDICAQLGKYQEAKEYAEVSLAMARDMKDRKKIAESFLTIGKAHRCLSNFDNTLEALNKSLHTYQEIKDREGIARVYNGMGLTYWELGDYPQVLDYYLKALKINEELKKKDGISANLLNIGRVYWKMNNSAMALEYYFKAKNIHEEEGDKSGLGMVLNNIAAVYTHQENYSEALKYYKKSLEVKQQLGSKPLIASTLNNIGSNYMATGDIREAKKYFIRAQNIWEEINDKKGICVGLINLGYINRQEGRYDKALQQLYQALTIAKEIKIKNYINYAYQYISLIYADKGDYKKALEFHQKFKESSDSIFNEQTSKKIADIQKNYDMEKKEKEIVLLKKDKEIQKLALSRQDNIRNFLIIVSALILLLAFVIYTRYRLKVKVMQELKKEIEERKKAEAELVKSRKLETVAILAGGIAHDFNNLLFIIIGSLSLAKEKLHTTDSNTQGLVAKAEKASLQAAELVKKFITFSSGGLIKRDKITLSGIFANINYHFREIKDFPLTTHLPADVKPIYGDERQLQQVILNLLRNAYEAAKNNIGLNITLTAQNINLEKENEWSLKPGEYVKISIIDSGRGIPPHIMEKIFDPYFTTKERGTQKGMGLGLTICYAIVKKHEGHMVVTSDLNQGTTVDIYLPAFQGD